MKVLILGGGGIIATYLTETRPAGTQITLAYRQRLPLVADGVGLRQVDLTDAAATRRMLAEERPDAVIDAAGTSGVDDCEREPAAARASNLVATQNLIDALVLNRAKLVYLSTNAVYDGRRAPYAEDSIRQPVNEYGRIKCACEELVRQQSPSGWCIARLIFVYGWSRAWSRRNPLTWLVDSLQAGQPVKLVTGVRENPLAAPFAAQALWRVIARDVAGELNIAGMDTVNRYELGLAVADIFQLDAGLIQPVPNSYFSQLAPRPEDSSYVTEKMVRVLGLPPLPLRDGLRQLRDQRPALDEPLLPGRLGAAE